MDLLDRYLANVGFLLPFSERGEILAELRDILLSKMEDREEELGRPLNPLEREAVIHDFGHPFVVAGGYRRDKEIVGAALYPFWLLVMQIGLVAVLAAAVIAGLLHGFQHADLAAGIGWGVGQGVRQLITLTGVATLVFLYLERTGDGRRLLARWRPSQLPAISFERLGQGKAPSRSEYAFEVVAGIVVLLFWSGLAPAPHDYPIGHGQTIHITAGSVWTEVYWLVFALLLARIIGNMLDLFRLGSAVFRRGYRLAASLASLAAFVLILGHGLDLGAPHFGFSREALAAGPFVRLAGLPRASAEAVSFGANLGIAIGLVSGAVGSVLEAALSAFTLIGLSRRSPATS